MNGQQQQQHPKEVFCGNLSFFCTEEDLQRLFQDYSRVTSVRIVRNREQTKSLMFGFVRMETTAEAEECARVFNGQMFMGRRIKVTHPSVPDIARPDPVTDRDSPPVYVGVMCPMDNAVMPTEVYLRKLMVHFGPVNDVTIREFQFNENNQRYEGYGFVSFCRKQSAMELAQSTGLMVDGIAIKPSLSFRGTNTGSNMMGMQMSGGPGGGFGNANMQRYMKPSGGFNNGGGGGGFQGNQGMNMNMNSFQGRGGGGRQNIGMNMNMSMNNGMKMGMNMGNSHNSSGGVAAWMNNGGNASMNNQTMHSNMGGQSFSMNNGMMDMQGGSYGGGMGLNQRNYNGMSNRNADFQGGNNSMRFNYSDSMYNNGMGMGPDDAFSTQVGSLGSDEFNIGTDARMESRDDRSNTNSFNGPSYLTVNADPVDDLTGDMNMLMTANNILSPLLRDSESGGQTNFDFKLDLDDSKQDNK